MCSIPSHSLQPPLASKILLHSCWMAHRRAIGEHHRSISEVERTLGKPQRRGEAAARYIRCALAIAFDRLAGGPAHRTVAIDGRRQIGAERRPSRNPLATPSSSLEAHLHVSCVAASFLSTRFLAPLRFASSLPPLAGPSNRSSLSLSSCRLLCVLTRTRIGVDVTLRRLLNLLLPQPCPMVHRPSLTRGAVRRPRWRRDWW